MKKSKIKKLIRKEVEKAISNLGEVKITEYIEPKNEGLINHDEMDKYFESQDALVEGEEVVVNNDNDNDTVVEESMPYYAIGVYSNGHKFKKEFNNIDDAEFFKGSKRFKSIELVSVRDYIG